MPRSKVSWSRVAQSVGTLDVFVDRAAHIFPRCYFTPGVGRPIIRLPNDVTDPRDFNGKLVAVSSHAAAFVDDPGDSAFVEWLQRMFAGYRGDQPRVGHGVVFRPCYGVIEVGLHFEKLLEFRVALRQQVVELPVTE